jgi:esterase/lipase
MILLLHGALATAQEMEPLKKLLPADTLSHTFQGHDNRPIPEDFRIETFMEELDQYLLDHKLANVTVVGHSMGGYVALSHAALAENSPICRIVTYGTKFDWSEKALASMLATLHPENEALMDYLKKKFQDKGLPLLLATTHMMAHLERLDGLLEADLQDVLIPVEIVLGEKDKVVTLEESQAMVEILPHGQLHILKESRHEMERADLAGLARIILGQ